MTDARIIFDYYLSKKLVQHRNFDVFEPKIRNRLKHFTVEELKLCIDNLSASQYHRDGGYISIEQIVRNDERIEFWLARKPVVGRTTLHIEEGKDYD